VAAEWFDQVLEGVKAAHEAGIIHRDLKPENLLIARDGRLKILDFGLAKIRQLEASSMHSLTAPGTVLGTLHYMSPEQLAGEEVDERSDIFSFGVMVAEALTGRRPFGGKTSTELVASILHQPFHLAGGAPQVQRLDEVLQKCLAKERAQRFASVADLQKELIPALADCPPLAAAEPASDEDATTSLPTA
jgi:serine/threonine protein kinase